ncbi:DUF2254 domain-containing protein, partial [Nostoc sp. CHAB 5834]|nr:DUF2254 domain-containing protein [Nostoc sp. CHAB 5834]
IDHLFPQRVGQPMQDPAQNDRARNVALTETGWLFIRADQTGYLQRLDTDGLLDWAIDRQVVLRIEQPLGTFIHEGTHLFSVRHETAPPDSAETAAQTDGALDFVTVGRHRSMEQDANFGVQQLVDIILKALSPGINDTTTATMAIDYLGALMRLLTEREFPSPYRFDQQQQLRVIAVTEDFDDYLRYAFDLPRINAKGNHVVMGRLLWAMAESGKVARSVQRRFSLQQQAVLLLQQAEQTLATEDEKTQVRALYHKLEPAWQPLGEGNTVSNF